MSSQFTAFFGGQWISQNEVRIDIDDLGFFQSATVVERFRTWNRRLPPLADHAQRFAASAQALRIAGLPNQSEIESIVGDLLDRNQPAGDVGVTLFATPGRRGGQTVTFCAHLTELNLDRIAKLQTSGQPLVVTDVQQPAPECWSRGIKVRSRLHYYLADLQAGDRVKDGLGVLLDTDGSVTETSTSNVLVVQGWKLVMPPQDRVLPGVMAKRVCQLAEAAGYQFERRVIAPEELQDAEEVWLTGSEVGLWFAREVDGVPKPLGSRCRVLQSQLWQTLEQGEAP